MAIQQRKNARLKLVPAVTGTVKAAARYSVTWVACVALAVTLLSCGGTSNRGETSGSSARDGVSEIVAAITRPTRLAWGPDGRLYVATLFGEVRAYRFDDAWNVTDTRVYTGLGGEVENEILGIAFDPHEDTGPTTLYVAHANINSGGCSDSFFPYSGKISRLTAPDFDNPDPVVTGLPASPGSHGVNGLAFDDFGDLYVSVGGVTNAGIASCDQGGMPESPLSGAVVKVPLSVTRDVANIVYRQRADGSEDDNQVNGATVDLDPGSGVSLFAAGFRNAFALLFASTGQLYALDNGADSGGGPASTSASTTVSIGTGSDSLDLVHDGGYYGHPNRNRGRDDAQQNVYVAAQSPSPGPGVQLPLLRFRASMNGLAELRTHAWGPGLRGGLIAQRWNEETVFIELTAAGSLVSRSEDVPIEFPSLDVVMGPGGALLGADFSENAVRLMRAERVRGIDDIPTGRLAVFDVHPWRAPAAGGRTFVLGGQGFDQDGGIVEVRFGDVVATVTRVSATRIEGIIPPLNAGTARRPGQVATLIDITVEVDGRTSTMIQAFLPLPEIAP